MEGRQWEEVDRYDPGTFPSFLCPCFVAALPVIAAPALAVGESAEEEARVKQPTASEEDGATRSPLLHMSCFVFPCEGFCSF